MDHADLSRQTMDVTASDMRTSGASMLVMTTDDDDYDRYA